MVHVESTGPAGDDHARVQDAGRFELLGIVAIEQRLCRAARRRPDA